MTSEVPPTNELGINKLVTIDNLDDRREIWHMIESLTVAERVAFLYYAIEQINTGIMLRSDPPWILHEVTNTTGEANETYMDLMFLFAQYGIPKEAVLNSLHKFLVQRDKIGTKNSDNRQVDVSIRSPLV